MTTIYHTLLTPEWKIRVENQELYFKRIIVALIKQYGNEDGSISIPSNIFEEVKDEEGIRTIDHFDFEKDCKQIQITKDWKVGIDDSGDFTEVDAKSFSTPKEKTKLFFVKTLDIVSKYSIFLKSYAQEKSAYYYDKFKKWLLGSNTFTIGFVLCFTHIIFIEPTRETYVLLSIIALVSIAKHIYDVESFRYDCIKKKFDHGFYVHNDRLEQFNIKSKIKTLKTACLILSVMYWRSVINLLFLFLSKEEFE
jgi:hypothetical protein